MVGVYDYGASPDSAVRIVALGGVELVIAAMRNHRADSAMWPRIVKQAPEIAFRVELQIELQCWATFTLANLAMHPDIALHIARAGGVDVIIAAMRTHKACIRERERRESARARNAVSVQISSIPILVL